MRARLLLLAVVALAGAGCLTAAPGGPGQVAVCLEKPVEASWSEPGLGDGFAQAARRAGWSVETTARHDGFLPWGEGFVTALSWYPEDPLAQPRVTLSDGPDPGFLVFGMPVSPDPAEGERTFLAFLALVGLEDHPERDAWVRVLVHGEMPSGVWQDGGYRQVEARAQPDLSGPLAALRDAPLTSTGLGGGMVEVPPWRAYVALPFHVVTVPLEKGSLTVWSDAHGAFRARTAVPDAAEGWPTLQARVRDAFAALELPSPTFSGASGGNVTC